MNKNFFAVRQRLLLRAEAEHNTPEGTGGGVWLLHSVPVRESVKLLQRGINDILSIEPTVSQSQSFFSD